MDLHVTKHAIKRYRERLCDYSSPDKHIVDKLKRIAGQGKVVDAKSDTAKCREVGFNGISIILVVDGKHATILTCLGDATYRKWIKRQSPRDCLGRCIRFPKQVG